MELDIKHLAAYLPYGLKILYYNGNATPYIKELVSLNTKLLSGRILGNEKHKPILYPLDYLTKEITHNGETFVPIAILNHNFRPFSKDISIFQYINGNFEIEIQTQEYSQSIDLFDGYKIIQMLLEWKFDIFNLIENKLAIPVTEDFNPYK